MPKTTCILSQVSTNIPDDYFQTVAAVLPCDTSEQRCIGDNCGGLTESIFAFQNEQPPADTCKDQSDCPANNKCMNHVCYPLSETLKILINV